MKSINKKIYIIWGIVATLLLILILVGSLFVPGGRLADLRYYSDYYFFEASFWSFEECKRYGTNNYGSNETYGQGYYPEWVCERTNSPFFLKKWAFARSHDTVD